MKRGLFITFEGGEGAGKSSQVKNLARWLREEGYAVITTREPGGSPGAEAVRHVLLSGTAETFGPRMEALLFAAARADHVEHVIRPALERGTMVLCDRFMDSTRVYQGITGNLDAGYISTLEHVSVADLVPDLTIICDLDPEEGLRRASERRGIDTPDRFEKESTEIHRLRREAFLDIAAEESGRCVVIDAGRDFESAAADIEAVIRKLLHAHDQNSNPPQDEAIS